MKMNFIGYGRILPLVLNNKSQECAKFHATQVALLNLLHNLTDAIN